MRDRNALEDRPRECIDEDRQERAAERHEQVGVLPVLGPATRVAAMDGPRDTVMRAMASARARSRIFSMVKTPVSPSMCCTHGSSTCADG